MSTSKRTAIIVGILFIMATVSSSLGFFFRDPILEAPDYLVQVSANQTRMLIGMLLLLVDCIAVVFIPAALYRTLKRHGQGWALAYLAFRTIESVVIIVGEICLLALLALSQEYVEAGGADPAAFQTLGAVLLAAYRQGTHLIGIQIVFSVTAVILNQVLIRSKLVPRWISVWGLIGAVLLLAAGLITLFGPGPLSTITTLMNLPIAVQEMVFAVWLIVRGFNPSAIASEPA